MTHDLAATIVLGAILVFTGIVMFGVGYSAGCRDAYDRAERMRRAVRRAGR